MKGAIRRAFAGLTGGLEFSPVGPRGGQQVKMTRLKKQIERPIGFFLDNLSVLTIVVSITFPERSNSDFG